MKGWYVPGIVTGWIMGIAAIYSIYVLNTLYTITAADCIIGTLCVIFIMLFLQVMVQKSANYSISKMIANMKNHLLKK